MRASAILVAATFGMLIGGTGLAEAQREPPPSRVESRVPPPSEVPPSRPGEASRPPEGGGGDAAPPEPPQLFLPNVLGLALECHPIKKWYQSAWAGVGVLGWALIVTNVSGAAFHPGTVITLSAGNWTSTVQLGGQFLPGAQFEVADLTLGSPFPYGQATYDSCTAIVL